MLRIVRLIAAALLGITAVNHARLALLGTGDVPRHVVFIGINVLLSVLLLRGSRWALPAVALVALQQIPSHGGDLLDSLHGSDPRGVDWISAGVVLFWPLLVVVLVGERRSKP